MISLDDDLIDYYFYQINWLFFYWIATQWKTWLIHSWSSIWLTPIQFWNILRGSRVVKFFAPFYIFFLIYRILFLVKKNHIKKKENRYRVSDLAQLHPFARTSALVLRVTISLKFVKRQIGGKSTPKLLIWNFSDIRHYTHTYAAFVNFQVQKC